MITGNINLKKVCLVVSVMLLAACDDGSTSESGAGAQLREAISLDAFTGFQCSSAWTNRDGALGIRAGDGSGVCKAPFNGPDGRYRIVLIAQTEFDGASPYSIQVNDSVIKTGEFPYSTGQLVCDCPNWRQNCPDQNVDIETRPVSLNQGDVIAFAAQEVYPCGAHGAYAKWHGMKLVPLD